jgi:hypothetical protein
MLIIFEVILDSFKPFKSVPSPHFCEIQINLGEKKRCDMLMNVNFSHPLFHIRTVRGDNKACK